MNWGCDKKDCFAYFPKRPNNCNALTDIEFGMRDCPFYKNYKDMAKELKELEDKKREY